MENASQEKSGLKSLSQILMLIDASLFVASSLVWLFILPGFVRTYQDLEVNLPSLLQLAISTPRWLYLVMGLVLAGAFWFFEKQERPVWLRLWLYLVVLLSMPFLWTLGALILYLPFFNILTAIN